MKKTLALFYWIFMTAPLWAANPTPNLPWIKVIESETGQPLEGVSVTVNGDFIGETSPLGKVQLPKLQKSDALSFYHTSFATVHLTYSALKNQGFLVRMKESVLNIQEVVIKANRIEQEYKSTSQEIRVIDKKNIDNQYLPNTADLIGLDPNVFIQKSQGGGGSPMIRGMSTSRVLILIDGVRFNNAIFREGNVHNIISIDGQSVANAEIQLGPGSVIHGSDALGGVMHLNTFEPHYGDSSEVLQSLTFSLSEQTSQLRGRTHFRVNYGQKRWAGLTAITYSDYNDITMGKYVLPWTPPEHLDNAMLTCVPLSFGNLDTLVKPENAYIQSGTGYQQRNVIQKFKWRLADRMELKTGAHLSRTTNLGRYDRLIQTKNGMPKYATWNYGPQLWALVYASLESRAKSPFYDYLGITASAQHYQESRDVRKFRDPVGRLQVEHVRIAGLNVDASKKWLEWNLNYGAEYVFNYVGSKANYYVSNFSDTIWEAQSRYADGSNWQSASLFASAEHNLGEHWKITAGGRANSVAMFTPISFNGFQENAHFFVLAPSGQVGLTHYGEGYKYFFSLSSGFRAPNVDDASKVFDSQPGALIVPNTKLREERLYNAELGLKQQLGTRWMIDASFYYSYLNNAMIRAPYTWDGADSVYFDGEYSQVLAIQNLDYAWMWGYHFSLRTDLSNNMHWTVGLSHPFGTDSNGERLRHVSPLNANSQLTYQKSKWRGHISVKYNSAVAAEDMPYSERSKTDIYAINEDGQPYSPAWFSVDLQTSYAINKFITARMGVENIMDVRYRPYSSGISMPGRALFVSLKGSI